MDRLTELILRGEEWILLRLLHYNSELGYVRHSPALEAAWRMSVHGLCQALLATLTVMQGPPEIKPDEDFAQDPIAAFVVTEARRHRKRGVTLGMFLGLLKCHRRSFLDLLEQSDLTRDLKQRYQTLVARFFDRIEICVAVEWATCSSDTRLEELQQANRILTTEKNRFLTLVESLSSPLLLLDKDNRVDHINRAASSFLGRSDVPGTEYYGRQSHVSYLDGESMDPDRSTGSSREAEPAYHFLPWLHEDLAAFAGLDEDERVIEKTVVHRGCNRHFRVHLSRLPEASGRFAGSAVVIDDVTDLRNTEEALRESETRYRTLFENMDEGVAIYSAEDNGNDFVFKDYNRAAEKIEKISKDEVIGRRLLDVFPGVRDFGLFDALQRVYRTGRPERCPLAKYSDERVAGWRENFVYSLPTREIVAVYRDMTEHKLSEDALKSSELKYRELTSLLPQMIFETGVDLRLTFVNDSVSDLTGYSREDVPAIPDPFQFIVPEDRERASMLAERVLNGEKVGGHEFTILKKDGTRLPVIIYGNPIVRDNAVVGIRGLAVDISPLKQAEQEKETLKNQLFQAQKMQALGTLTGGIAHDFNNMLTIILGYSELLISEKSIQDPDYEDLNKIVKTARTAADLVQRLLTFSQQTHCKPRRVNLNHQIREITRLLRKTVPRMVEIRLNLDEHLAPVRADPTHMEQIVMNLATNASEAMPEGGILTIETRNVVLDEEFCRKHHGTQPGDYVLLEVSDTGIGIDQSTLDRIFDPFFSTKGWDSRKGTGLGLPIVQGMVQQHQGYITCSSEYGRGTTFFIYLPVMKEDLNSEQKPKADQLYGGSETVLLVDDEEHVRELAKRCLNRAGYSVLEAANGIEAIDLYSERRDVVSLVVLDLIMPQMGGRTCLECLLEIDPKVRILVASGCGAESEQITALKNGAKGFVHKPFQINEFLKAVRKVLDAV